MHKYVAVISDLHVGEGVLDDFDSELENHLVNYLEWLASQREPSELIINGDFLDFAQASPWRGNELESTTTDGVPLCFTEEHSVSKFLAILQAHPKVFAALRDFLSVRDGNRLVILPGNHDVDFFWTRVRERFVEAVAPGILVGQMEIRLDRAYRPVSCPWLWIEHGHQYDPVNRFFSGGEEFWSAERPPIFTANDGMQRLYECTGTRFLVRFVNRLDARYPYVDNVKPFSRFLKIFGASALSLGWGPLDAAIAVTQMLTYLARTAVTRRADLMTEVGSAAPRTTPLAGWVNSASPDERRRLKALLNDAGLQFNRPLDMLLERPDDAEKVAEFLGDHLDLVERLGETDASLFAAPGTTLTLAAGFTGNETQDLKDGAAQVAAREGATTVVMGHTHESVEQANGFAYFNTGSWTRYYVFGDDERTAPWRVLREGSYERFPYRLRYAFVRPGAASATLETWHERSKT